jgi:hypothetical protein
MKPKLLATLFLCSAMVCHGALLGTTVLEVRTTGSDLNGGGWVPGSTGTDWSQQDAPQYSVTDAVTGAGATVTSATANFGTDVVGNICFMEGGTFPLGKSWWHIITRNSATQITLDRNVGAVSTGSTLRIGGALNHPSRAQIINNNLGMDIWIKAGTYNITSAGAGVVTGRIQTTGAVGNAAKWEGYTTTRGDRSTKPILLATTLATGAMMESTGNVSFVNIECDAAGKNLSPFAATGTTRYILCTGRNSLGTGFSLGSADRCYAVSCASGFTVSTAFGCVSQSCTTGFTNLQAAIRCIDIGSTTGFSMGTDGCQSFNCVAYGGAGHGFVFGAAGNQAAYNCIAEGRTGKGFNGTTNRNVWLFNCAGYNNSTGTHDSTDLTFIINVTTLGDSPFVNAAASDFTLNSVVTGGQVMLAAGIPRTFATGATLNESNIGVTENSGLQAGETAYVFIQ